MMIKEAASFLGVTGNTLRNWQSAGKIKVYLHPINNYRLYKREDLEELLKMLKIKGKPEVIVDERHWSEKDECITLEDRLGKLEYLHECVSKCGVGPIFNSVTDLEKRVSNLEKMVYDILKRLNK